MTNPFSGMSRERLEALDEATRVDDSVVRAALARVPPSWTLLEPKPAGGYFKRGSLQVGFTVQRYGDARVWLHVSACGRKGNTWGPGDPRHPSSFYLPSYEELKRVKADFIGEDRWAYQIFAPRKKHVNVNPYVLHLYALMDQREDGESALPDFTMGVGYL